MPILPGCLPISLPHPVKEFLKEQLNHLKSYGQRVKELETDVKSLLDKLDRVEHKVEEEEIRYGRGIDRQVGKWLEEVDNTVSEYKDFLGDKRHACAVFDLFSSGYLPKPGIRYRLSRKAYDITRKVNGLLQTTNLDTFSYWLGPPSMDDVFSNVVYESFASRNEIMKKIMDALEDPSVRMIGLYGLSGVGKTTLAKEVAKKALEDKMFNVVVMANVTRSPDIRKIQGQIIDMLGMKLEEESDTARAARIRGRLKNEKENVLIILDDVWANLDLHMLGIPFDNDEDDGQKNLKESGESLGPQSTVTEENNPSAMNKKKIEKLTSASSSKLKTKETLSRYRGCEVLLISEAKQVLLSQMDGKENSIFSLEVLQPKEAETLFKKMVGIDNNSEFKKLATQIANNCEGLPMQIVTNARALKNKSSSVWEGFLRKLERQNLAGTLDFSTKLSYDLLKNEELKNTFLLCARMGYDVLIMDLVKYCIGLGFLEGIHTVKEARDRVSYLVAELKGSGLLSNSYSRDRFTMQDIVRGAALSIASRDKHVLTMTKEKLDEWPDEDKLKRYAAISLQHCDIIEGFHQGINCPRLKVFHVDNNGPRLKISDDNFFKRMKELKVLILTGFDLSPSLPSSITCLSKLRMLCLEQCLLGDDLSMIGELKRLRILSLSGSDFKKLPTKLEQLAKLQILDISNCSKLREIPSNVISSLTSLEELYMRNNSIEWDVEGQTNEIKNACLSELRNLNQLTSLDIQVRNVSHLPKDLFFDKLYSYKIVIGDLNAYSEPNLKMPHKYEESRFLAIRLENGSEIHSQKGVKMLFEKVGNLWLEELNGVQDVFYELNLKGFPYLKHLSIVSNSGVEYIINPRDKKHPEKVFPKLELLYLYNLKNLKEICCCDLSAPSFGKLKEIKIKLCNQLSNVFVIDMVRLLTVLKSIEVSECNSLEQIVKVESQRTPQEIKFPELRSLRLQSLSNFTGFTDLSTGETARQLFHQKVVVSKLERIELSSIPIDEIWSDQPLASPYFENLIYLDVNGCWNLKQLLSFSMAKCLGNLQSLFVSECENMKYILERQGSDANVKGIFPKLKSIKLSAMKSLSKMWNSSDSSEAPSSSFTKLDTLVIEECDKFVFPCNMLGIFRSLCNLRVTKCKSMKAIFDQGDQNRDAGHVINLQDVHLEALPKLERVWKWNKDREGILNLEKLQKIQVHKCHSLENIFPVSVAECLKNLEYLGVRDCFELREIVAMGEETNTNTGSPLPFVFYKLTTIKFSDLPKLRIFYSGKREVRCPALNDLSIELCDRLRPFKNEIADPQRKPILFPEEVINKLKSKQIEWGHAESSSSYTQNYRSDNLEELQLSGLMNTEILYSFLHSSPNLKSLWLNNCSFEKLVPQVRPPETESLGVVPKLKSLKLIDLPSLENTGFEHDIVLQRIESLIVKNCPVLLAIVTSSVSFTQLTILEVVNCEKLENLMTPSTAKSLVQLTTMKVITCESLREIVSEQRIEEQNTSKIVIAFRQLKTLELVNLGNLSCFSSSMWYAFELPSLEKLVVSGCPKMKKFSHEVTTTAALRKIYVSDGKKDQRHQWKDDLNGTIGQIFNDKIFFEVMEELAVSDQNQDVLNVWQGKGGPTDNWFKSLKTLKLESVEIQPYAIPSNVLRCLKSLKELQVRNCINVEVIFEINDAKIKGTEFQLKKLTLFVLPNLTHVWDKNCQGILSFQKLQQVLVINCEKLQTLFPATLAKNLDKLEKLDISYCSNLQEIVGKEKQTTIENFSFPRLTSLGLYMLPKLTCFYPERFTLECPELSHLTVEQCDKLELFQSEQEVLSEVQKVLSNLEVLTLNWKNTCVLKGNGQFPKSDQLNHLNLYFEDCNDESTLPIEILEKAPNLETIEVSSCSGLKEMFSSEIVDKRMLGHLKALVLNDLSQLQSLGLNNSSWLNTICEKLRELHVLSCPELIMLIHSQVCFSHLRELSIEECHRLKYLFEASTAKKLVHLEEMRIVNCESMKEIVAKEQDEKTGGEIRFPRLDTIVLRFLPSLECFYSGNATLRVQSMTQVHIEECPKMRVFSQGPMPQRPLAFRGIQVDFSSNLVFQDDLNSSVEMVFLQQAQEHLILGDSPMLQKIWLKKIPVPDRCFSNLKSLIVEGCQFLPDANATVPSHILPLLSNLEELEVRECNSVKAIFDVTDTPTHHTDIINMGPTFPLSLPLKKLTLKKLPILEHVWNGDPQGSLILPSLEEVVVEECDIIESLFPASVARDKLKALDVKQCDKLVEIVANDEAATERTIKELTMFPGLTLLRLWNLPNLKCIYPGMHNLDWPMLKELDVFHCEILKIFATKSQDSPDSHPEDQERSPTDQQAFVSVEKVTPHLEQLSLNKEDTTMIEQEQFRVDFQKIKYLKLQCFHEESDVFPYFFLSEVALPNIEKLGVFDSDFKEIFPSQRPDTECTRILSQPKELELNNLHLLNSIGLDPFLENLETLKVLACKSLRSLASSTLSFSRLIALNVEQCHGLKYLFTSSVAKSLCLLKTMIIIDCKSIEEIVAKQGNEPEQDEMNFGQLEILSLTLLPKLKSFYSGNSSLKFPSLRDASFTQCRSMKRFCHGDVEPKDLQGKIDGVLWKRQFGERSSRCS